MANLPADGNVALLLLPLRTAALPFRGGGATNVCLGSTAVDDAFAAEASSGRLLLPLREADGSRRIDIGLLQSTLYCQNKP